MGWLQPRKNRRVVTSVVGLTNRTARKLLPVAASELSEIIRRASPEILWCNDRVPAEKEEKSPRADCEAALRFAPKDAVERHTLHISYTYIR